MRRIVNRCEELSVAFDEIIKMYGYSDVKSSSADQTSKVAVWLILEHIWLGRSYDKDIIIQARENRKALIKTNKKVVQLAEELAEALREQDSMYETYGFSKQSYQSSINMLEQAGQKIFRYSSFVSDKVQRLYSQYDLKYWPERADLIEEIATHERNQSTPQHHELTDEVLNGRESIAKDFVISFDGFF